MGIKLYLSNTSGNRMMWYQQAHIRQIFEMKCIHFEEVDVADPRHKQDKERLQQVLSGAEPGPLPPQIFKDKEHCGDYESFFKALEREELFRYLGLAVPSTEVEAQRSADATTSSIIDHHRPKDALSS